MTLSTSAIVSRRSIGLSERLFLPARHSLRAVFCRRLTHLLYDADSLTDWLRATHIKTVIPSSRARKKPYLLDQRAYKRRNVIPRLFCRPNNWRRIATRYARLTTNHLEAVALVSAVIA